MCASACWNLLEYELIRSVDGVGGLTNDIPINALYCYYIHVIDPL